MRSISYDPECNYSGSSGAECRKKVNLFDRGPILKDLKVGTLEEMFSKSNNLSLLALEIRTRLDDIPTATQVRYACIGGIKAGIFDALIVSPKTGKHYHFRAVNSVVQSRVVGELGSARF